MIIDDYETLKEKKKSSLKSLNGLLLLFIFAIILFMAGVDYGSYYGIGIIILCIIDIVFIGLKTFDSVQDYLEIKNINIDII